MDLYKLIIDKNEKNCLIAYDYTLHDIMQKL